MIDFERGQGATEYLLMLAAVLVVVAAAVYFMMGTGTNLMVSLSGSAEVPSGYDNRVVFTIGSITPDNVEADIQVIKPDGTSLTIEEATNTGNEDPSGASSKTVKGYLGDGNTVSLSCDSEIPSGSTVKIMAEGSSQSFDILT